MFQARHDELLEYTEFRHPSSPGTLLQVLECWKYAGVDQCTDNNWRLMSIEDGEVEDWLVQKGRFKPMGSPRESLILEGGIRLIFCERNSYRPPGIRLSETSFLAVEKAFNLPRATIQALFHYQGLYSKHFEYSPSTGLLDRLGILLKVPQKINVANYLLSLSYDIKTSTTTAVLIGTFAHQSSLKLNNTLLCQPLALQQGAALDDRTSITQISRIIAHIQATVPFWSSPLLLPTIILENYMNRSDLFSWNLDDRIVAIENQTGVVFAGRLSNVNRLRNQTIEIPKGRIATLTKDMHSLLADIIFYERVVEWSFDCAGFLAGLARKLGSSEEIQLEKRAGLKSSSRDVLENLELLSSSAKSMCGFQSGLKQRVQSQINVLYSFIAQIDNSLNAKIAVSSARDSSAMKTLALITTVFLPGTYIATLFSMSMFSWGSGGSSGNVEVSNKFWIYWTVTIPLTLVLMVTWRVWWLYQERVYQREVREAVHKLGNGGME